MRVGDAQADVPQPPEWWGPRAGVWVVCVGTLHGVRSCMPGVRTNDRMMMIMCAASNIWMMMMLIKVLPLLLYVQQGATDPLTCSGMQTAA